MGPLGLMGRPVSGGFDGGVFVVDNWQSTLDGLLFMCCLLVLRLIFTRGHSIMISAPVVMMCVCVCVCVCVHVGV